MIKVQRQEEILNILHKEKHCTVEYLSKNLFVAPITIRRDLTAMEQNGLVKRCYGGASIIEHENREIPLIVRESNNSEIKSIIAKKAARLIAKGDTVFLDASSTTLHIINYLYPEQDLTVITNSIKALQLLGERHITVYSTGGFFLENSMAFVGIHAEAMIKSINANIMFFSSQGISEDGEITDFSERETSLRQIMLSNAKVRYFLHDSTKYGKKYLFHVCNIEEIDGVINENN